MTEDHFSKVLKCWKGQDTMWQPTNSFSLPVFKTLQKDSQPSLQELVFASSPLFWHQNAVEMMVLVLEHGP